MMSVSMAFESKGHSLRACFLQYLGQKIDNPIFSKFCFFCILRVFISSLRLPKISVFKVSRKFPNSSLLNVPAVDLLVLDKRGSLGLLPTPALPLEICKHKSQIFSNGSWEISPFPVRLRRSIHSS